MARVVVAGSSDSSCSKLSALLASSGFQVFRCCTSGSELSALICNEAGLDNQRIMFECNKRFEEETVTEMVALIINKHPELNVLSFAVNYNPSNKRALIALKKSP